MKVLLDTSILYPALTRGHPQHLACRSLISRLEGEAQIFILNTHLIAELYSNLTRIPSLKIPARTAQTVIQNLVARFDYIDLNMTDYLAAVERCASREIVSGAIFDALHLQAAIKAEVNFLYTVNRRDFDRLYEGELGVKIASIDS
ncbi:MAG: PIN domain-containing protein [Bacteroidota bacterium]